MRSIQSDISRSQGKIADISRDEARASEKIAQASLRLSRVTSPSQAQFYQREIQRQQQEIVRLQSKRADEGRNLARKQGELGDCNLSYLREQEREMKKGQHLLKKIDQENRDRESAALKEINSLRSRLASEKGNKPESQDLPYSAFISHASEDKDELVRPLAEALQRLGHKVWYDEYSLKVGDSLRRSIDQGLRSSRFGVVVLSNNFFAKNWPQYELDGLVAKEQEGQKVILPLWHRVSKSDVLRYSPTLADKVALNTAMFTAEELAAKLHEVLAINTGQ